MNHSVLIYNARVFAAMSLAELVQAAGLTEVTPDTYLYVDDGATLCAIEKPDRLTYPVDEYEPIGYVSAYQGGVSEARAVIAAR